MEVRDLDAHFLNVQYVVLWQISELYYTQC